MSAGATTLFRPSVLAELASPIVSRAGVREFRPARVERAGEGEYFATPLAAGEAFLTGYATANGLLAVPEAASDVPTGGILPVLLLEGECSQRL